MEDKYSRMLDSAMLLASWGWRAEFQARNAADEQTRIAES
jgi:hypothetical protein